MFIIDSNGEVIQNNFTFENSQSGYELLLSKLPNVDRQKMRVGLESTGHNTNNLIDFLIRELPGKSLQSAQHKPLQISTNFAENKTDTVDTRIFTKMLFTEEYNSYSPVSYHYQELNSLTRHYHRLVEYRSKLKISVTRLLEIIFPELAKHVRSIHQNSSYALLLEALSPQMIANLHLTKLTNPLKEHSKGKNGRDKAFEIRVAASRSIVSNRFSYGFELQQTIRLIKNVQEELILLDRQLKVHMEEMYSPIASIPGISYRLGSNILAEFGDITKFSSPAKLLAFEGLDRTTHQS